MNSDEALKSLLDFANIDPNGYILNTKTTPDGKWVREETAAKWGAEQHYEGSVWMLESIRASLRSWPNGGCDIVVAQEVDRLISEPQRMGYAGQGELGTLGGFNSYTTKLKSRKPDFSVK